MNRRTFSAPLPAPLAALVVALLLAACTSAAGGSSSQGTGGAGGGGSSSSSGGKAVVTPAATRSVVGATMARNNRANAKLDSSLLASYEAGSAFALDDANYRADRAAHYQPPNSPFTVDLKEVGLTRQTTWPAAFLAIGTQKVLTGSAPKGPSCGTLLDFERLSQHGHWRIVLEPSVDGSKLPKLERAANGFTAALSPARIRQADALPGKVRAAFLQEETSGNLGPFTRADFTGSCWQIPNPRLDVVDAEASGYSQRDLFSTASRPDTAAFALQGGSTLVLFTLQTSDQAIQTTSSNPISWTHPSLSKTPGAAWAYFLPSGTYSGVDEIGALEMAVVLSPSGKHWTVVGSYEGVTKVTGHKAKAVGNAPKTTLTAWPG